MKNAMQALGWEGMVVMAVGAWVHFAWLIALGLCIVFIGWLRGVFHR
jgi:hypothetical protein